MLNVVTSVSIVVAISLIKRMFTVENFEFTNDHLAGFDKRSMTGFLNYLSDIIIQGAFKSA